MKQATNIRSSRLSLGSYTLVICDELTKTEANEFANKHSILCYPFQAIPDYLMQVSSSVLSRSSFLLTTSDGLNYRLNL